MPTDHEPDAANLAAERVEAILDEACKAMGESAYVDVGADGWVRITVPPEIAARICLEDVDAPAVPLNLVPGSDPRWSDYEVTPDVRGHRRTVAVPTSLKTEAELRAYLVAQGHADKLPCVCGAEPDVECPRHGSWS